MLVDPQKHLLLRLSEISYRVILASLFWTVVGGYEFAIVFGCECGLVVIWVLWQFVFLHATLENIFLALNQIIVMPAEFIVTTELDWYTGVDDDGCRLWYCPIYVLASCLCVYCGYALIPPYCGCCDCCPRFACFACCRSKNNDSKYKCKYAYTASRIAMSVIEWIVILVFGIIKSRVAF